MSETNGSTLKHQIEQAKQKLMLKVYESQLGAVDFYWDQWLRGDDRVPHRSADPPSRPSDRWYGRDWPRIRTYADLMIYRSASRMLVAENGYCKGALQATIDAVIGHGGTYKCDNPSMESYLNDWSSCYWAGCGDPWDDSPIRESAERQFLRRLMRDGEVFIFADEDEAKFMDPERCWPYSDGVDGWSFGIKTQTEPIADVNVVEMYSFQMEQAEWLFVEAKDMIHVLIEGTDSTVKRGIPFFAYDVFDSFFEANRVRSAVSMGARIRAKIAVLWKVLYGDKDDVDAMTLTDAMRGTSAQRDRFHGRDRDSLLPDGTEVYSPEGTEPLPPPGDNSPNHLAAVQADLRCAGAALVMPEYMISGDSHNANYASTRESGTPFVRRAEGLQSLVRGTALRLARKALLYAVNQGLFTEEECRQAKIDYTLPDVVITEFVQKATAVATLAEKGILTKDEARVALGYSATPGEVQ